ISSETILRPASISEEELLELIAKLNSDTAVDGLLVQLPLPGEQLCSPPALPGSCQGWGSTALMSPQQLCRAQCRYQLPQLGVGGLGLLINALGVGRAGTAECRCPCWELPAALAGMGTGTSHTLEGLSSGSELQLGLKIRGQSSHLGSGLHARARAHTWQHIWQHICQPSPAVSLPCAEHIDERRVCNAVSPHKDVDGFHVLNVGRMCLDQDSMLPATPRGVWEIIQRT
ncbi:hypothetical protein EK904_011568, partial [Melospiza melodia maxima]